MRLLLYFPSNADVRSTQKHAIMEQKRALRTRLAPNDRATNGLLTECSWRGDVLPLVRTAHRNLTSDTPACKVMVLLERRMMDVVYYMILWRETAIVTERPAVAAISCEVTFYVRPNSHGEHSSVTVTVRRRATSPQHAARCTLAAHHSIICMWFANRRRQYVPRGKCYRTRCLSTLYNYRGTLRTIRTPIPASIYLLGISLHVST